MSKTKRAVQDEKHSSHKKAQPYKREKFNIRKDEEDVEDRYI